MQNRPQRRQDGLIIRELDNEILIYDTENNKAHCLNQTAALVWKQCDGNTTATEMTRAISRGLGDDIDERVVWFALKQFNQDHLLEETVNMPPALLASGLNRRDMVRVLGLAAVVAVPLVTSIVAPTAAQAATCLPAGSLCGTPAQCCSGICAGDPAVCG
jgi:Coenzyme PQQ synthesis protein D (PqqD)